jgi:hypothetical protein
VVRGEPIGSVVVVRLNEAGQAARIVVNHRPLGSVLLWSRLMGEHFAGTRYARYFLSHDATDALHKVGGCDSGAAKNPDGGDVTAAEQACCGQVRVTALDRKETR